MKSSKLRSYAPRCSSDDTSATRHNRLHFAGSEALDQASGVVRVTIELWQSRDRERTALFQAADLLRSDLEGARNLIDQHHIRGVA